MYKCINGWTKEKMKAQVRKYNNGTKSENKGMCLYKNGNNRCAIGCFIPDDKIDELKSHKGTVESLLHHHPDLKVNMPLKIGSLISFQEAHDNTFVNDMRTHLCGWIDKNCED
jgi:hypothetical protein